MTRDDDYRSDYSADTIRYLAAGFGMGLLVGAALGILLAPKSGRETREQIKEFATEIGSRAKTVAGDVGGRAAETYGRVSERARTTAGEMTGRARKMGATITETAATMKEVTGKVTRAAKEGYKKTMEELRAAEADADEEAESGKA